MLKCKSSSHSPRPRPRPRPRPSILFQRKRPGTSLLCTNVTLTLDYNRNSILADEIFHLSIFHSTELANCKRTKVPFKCTVSKNTNGLYCNSVKYCSTKNNFQGQDQGLGTHAQGQLHVTVLDVPRVWGHGLEDSITVHQCIDYLALTVKILGCRRWLMRINNH